jgi:hypothetical protein
LPRLPSQPTHLGCMERHFRTALTGPTRSQDETRKDHDQGGVPRTIALLTNGWVTAGQPLPGLWPGRRTGRGRSAERTGQRR